MDSFAPRLQRQTVEFTSHLQSREEGSPGLRAFFLACRPCIKRKPDPAQRESRHARPPQKHPRRVQLPVLLAESTGPVQWPRTRRPPREFRGGTHAQHGRSLALGLLGPCTRPIPSAPRLPDTAPPFHHHVHPRGSRRIPSLGRAVSLLVTVRSAPALPWSSFLFLLPFTPSFSLFLARHSSLQPTLRCSPAPSLYLSLSTCLHSSMEFPGESAAAT